MMFNMGPVADLDYPDCRADGFFEAKQCHWRGCYCVTPEGKYIVGTSADWDRNLVCAGQKLSMKVQHYKKLQSKKGFYYSNVIF
jgi:hypothetical protein